MYTTLDDVMFDEIGINNFRVENMEDVEDMSIDNSLGSNASTKSGRADGRSLPSHATEAGRKKSGDDSSQESGKKRNGNGQPVTPDGERQKKRRQSEEDGAEMDLGSDQQSANNSEEECDENDESEGDVQKLPFAAGHGDVSGGGQN